MHQNWTRIPIPTDDGTRHNSRAMQKWFDDRSQSGFPLIAKSVCGLNYIEHLWDELGRNSKKNS